MKRRRDEGRKRGKGREEGREKEREGGGGAEGTHVR